MRPIFLLTALLMTSNASAVTEAECQAQGKSYIEALITRTGSFRKAHCRSKPVTLSDAQKSARVASAKAKHPGVRVSGHD